MMATLAGFSIRIGDKRWQMNNVNDWESFRAQRPIVPSASLATDARTQIVHFDHRRPTMLSFLGQLWTDDQGQDIAEYAVMLAVILVLVVGTIRLIGSNANNVFSQAASSIQ
jgi:Flp pilus assembly pilin Flp